MSNIKPGGATTAEFLSTAIGLNMMRRAGLQNSNVVVYNDNIEDIKTIKRKSSDNPVFVISLENCFLSILPFIRTIAIWDTLYYAEKLTQVMPPSL